ncbi:MAG: sigma-70 family RNA polymerase sigma factor [Pseudomonadota bacterium]
MGSPDVSSATILYGRHREQLIRLAYSIVGNSNLAEEIVQDAFLHFSTGKIPEDIKSPIAYLRAMVRNLSIETVRKIIRENRTYELYSEDLRDELSGQAELNPEIIFLWRSEFEAFHLALRGLPVATQEAVKLYLVEELNFRQIAERMQVSVGKAHSLVTDGISACEQKLREIRQ